MNSEKQIDFLEEMANFTFTSKYARYNEKRKRRETWDEAVSRLEKMHLKKFSWLPDVDKNEIKWAFDRVREKLVAPSMRSLQFGGPAIEAHEARIFNCSVRHIDSIRSFSESFYLLLCGCGLGIGLSHRHLNRLPNLVTPTDKTGTVITYVVEDSIEGWSDSVEALLMCYFKNTAYTGRKIVFDYSKIRAKGTPLKTGGGKAPGYKGLKQSHEKIKSLLDRVIEEDHVKRIKTIHVYDILMFVADAVLSGGVRRSATSVIFEPGDVDMMNAKTFFAVDKIRRFSKDEDTGKYYGKVTIKKRTYDVELSEWEYTNLKEKNEVGWFAIEPQRARSNNSVLLIRDQTTFSQFEDIIKKTQQFGEPGFVFGNHVDQLFNPCFEINFIPINQDGVCGVQFCNLTTQNGSKITSVEKFKEATKAATLIGTLQAAYTNFSYLSNVARELTESESLLGVSITGMMENPDILLNPEIQKQMAELAVDVNKEWSRKIGVKQSARITCVKPEGTSSIILKTSSGLHPHHSYDYLRRIQCNHHDNVYRHFKKSNPHATEPSVWSATKTDDVVTFPISVPKTSIVKKDLSSIQHLEYIKSTQKNWVSTGTTSANTKPIEHNVSCTVLVKDGEWENVIRYLYENRSNFSAVSLLSDSGDKTYQQAPMETVDTESDLKKWNDLISKWKKVDYQQLEENEDETQLQQEVACGGGGCEVK